MSKRSWLLLALILVSRAWAQGDAASSAFAEGKALGAGTIDKGQLSGPGTAKLIDCASQAPDVDSIVGRSVTPSISWPAIRRYGRHSR
ncbi:MAG: hypothetical protein IPL11_03630 [Candidatus Accumulibacter sp.]|nr:hypothetical protein [Accumulibacter sp.]